MRGSILNLPRSRVPYTAYSQGYLLSAQQIALMSGIIGSLAWGVAAHAGTFLIIGACHLLIWDRRCWVSLSWGICQCNQSMLLR